MIISSAAGRSRTRVIDHSFRRAPARRVSGAPCVLRTQGTCRAEAGRGASPSACSRPNRAHPEARPRRLARGNVRDRPLHARRAPRERAGSTGLTGTPPLSRPNLAWTAPRPSPWCNIGRERARPRRDPMALPRVTSDCSEDRARLAANSRRAKNPSAMKVLTAKGPRRASALHDPFETAAPCPRARRRHAYAACPTTSSCRTGKGRCSVCFRALPARHRRQEKSSCVFF